MSTITLDIVARDFASGTMKKVGLNAGGLAKSAASLGGAAVVGGIVKSINLAKDFDSTLRQVGIQTHQTGTGLKSLSGLAMKMGADTKFSAKDAADAMLELAKGGLTAADIKAGALKTTMTLAAAGSVGLGDAAGYVVQGMTTFGLKADQAKQVAVALAGGANASTASVESLGQALSQVGPGARNAGLSLQETVAALSAFDNAGSKGSDAGTSLKTMLARLVPSTGPAVEEMSRLGLLSFNAQKAMQTLRDNGVEPLGSSFPVLNKQLNKLAAGLVGAEPGSAKAAKAQQKLMLQTGATANAFYDQNGKIKSLSAVSQIMSKTFGTMNNYQRQAALQTIFGSDATRAATVLTTNGAKGIDKYVTAVNNQHTVQKMANSAMKGASGAWEQFTGSVETAGIKIGTALLPMFTKAANWGAKAINDVSGWGPQLKETFGPTIDVAKELLGVLRPIGAVVGGVGHAFGSLPGPLKSMAVQAAIAAVALPKISNAFSLMPTRIGLARLKVADFVSQLRNTETRGAAVRGALSSMGATARNAAGVGGIMALSAASSTSNQALKTLGDAGAGALLGFSMGGPVGAAIGGAAGGIIGLAKATDKSGQSFRLTKSQASDFASTLDKVTGATNEASRAAVARTLAANGTLKAGLSAGLSSRTLVDATLGDPNAIRRTKDAMAGLNAEADKLRQGADRNRPNTAGLTGAAYADAKRRADQYDGQIKDLDASTKALGSTFGSTGKKLHQMQVDTMLSYYSTTKLSTLTKGFPRQLVTELKVNGTERTSAQVKQLAAQYKLNPKQIVTVARMAGFNPSMSYAKRLAAGLRTQGKAGADGMNANLLKAGTVKPGFGPFLRGLDSGISTAKNHASTGGQGVGAALRDGFHVGFTGAIQSWASQAALATQRAIDAAKHQAESRSPSKKTMRLGHDVARGFEIGIQRRNVAISRVGAGTINSLVAGIRYRQVSLKTALSKVKAELSKQMATLTDLRQSAADIKGQTVSGFGSSIFDDAGDGPVTISSIMASQRAKATQAGQVARDVQMAISKGLSKSLVTQLANSGSSGAAQLHAIALGTTGQIGYLNTFDRATSDSLNRAGSYVAENLYGPQIRGQAKAVSDVQTLVAALNASNLGKDTTIRVDVDGETIIRAIRKVYKKQGKKSPV